MWLRSEQLFDALRFTVKHFTSCFLQCPQTRVIFHDKGHILFSLVNFIINKARKLKKLAFAVEVCVFPHRKVRHLNMERCTEMHKNVMFFVIELSWGRKFTFPFLPHTYPITTVTTEWDFMTTQEKYCSIRFLPLYDWIGFSFSLSSSWWAVSESYSTYSFHKLLKIYSTLNRKDVGKHEQKADKSGTQAIIGGKVRPSGIDPKMVVVIFLISCFLRVGDTSSQPSEDFWLFEKCSTVLFSCRNNGAAKRFFMTSRGAASRPS